MQSASTIPTRNRTSDPIHDRAVVLPENPPGGVTAGVDWARDDHAIAVVDARGREIVRDTVTHTAAGLRELLSLLRRAGADEVAIERPDGPVVTALLDAGITVVVISPNQIKHLRGRYGSAGNKDDRFDAYVLADTLRTDRARLAPLTPDRPETTTLRRACRTRKDLVRHRVAAANQLRAHLRTVLPAVVGLFSDIDSAITLAFLHRFATQDDIDALTTVDLADWLREVGYSGRVPATVLHTRLRTATRGITGSDADLNADLTTALVTLLTTLNTQITAVSAQIDRQLAAHTDAHVFTNLPRAGRIRAARLLAEIGDCRARFPTPESLACLAGVAPSTRQSGKHRAVGFRWACDKQLRDAVCDFAGDSRRANPWAADLYRRARTRGHDHAHAVRILARAWLYVIWHCWQDQRAYDPTRHRALQRLLDRQHEAA